MAHEIIQILSIGLELDSIGIGIGIGIGITPDSLVPSLDEYYNNHCYVHNDYPLYNL